jgi:DNA invertase Pin-like site-specific DNA recombinase
METSRKTRTRRSRSVTRVENYAVGYIRVSTDKQVESGAGMAAQKTLITAFATTQGLEIIDWYIEDEGVSGSITPMGRPAMSTALEALRTGPASVLLFKDQTRVGRNALDLLKLRERADGDGWRLASSDGKLDNATAAGRLMFTMLAGVAEYELEMIRSRTREALAEKKAAGVRLGAPSALPLDVVRRIVEERDGGAGWSAIARGLNEDGVLTARGKTWFPNTVRQTYNGQDAAKVAAAV